MIAKKKTDDDELAAGAELDRQKQLWPDRTLFADTEVRLRGGKDRQPLREVEIVRLQVDQGSLSTEDGARLIATMKRGTQVLPTPSPPDSPLSPLSRKLQRAGLERGGAVR